jgi:glyoxylase-like metal-dependent hydrolase (beta-lactamase superfamily II)
MSDVAAISVPIPWIGSVNLWLLRGEPLTLLDTGPSNERAYASLEEQLRELGVAIGDIELVLITHHHLDHSGLAARIKEVAGAQVAAHGGTARWGVDYQRRTAEERRFTLELMAAHGVPDELIAATEPFYEYISREGTEFETDVVLLDGETIEAGGRTLRVVFRPGHSMTDTLFVDDHAQEAFVGDHLLAKITTGAELGPTELPGDERRRALIEYLSNVRATAAMELRRCYTGHGPVIDDHRSLIEERIAFHNDRLDRITGLVRDGATTAFEIAQRLWSKEVAQTQTVLAIWEVVGHLDILVNRGTVLGTVDDEGRHHFRARIATAAR